MTRNEGTIDRVLRVVLGLILLALIVLIIGSRPVGLNRMIQ